MSTNIPREPTLLASGDIAVARSPLNQEVAERIFVGSSAGVITMVSGAAAEHHHMGD
jgi:hypothetical protein